MTSTWTILCILIIFKSSSVDSARILVYVPTPSISHQIVFRPLVHALVARGHEVTLVTTDPAFDKGNAPANLTEIDVHDVSYEIWKTLHAFHSGKKENLMLQVRLIFEANANIVEAQLQHPQLKEILKRDRKYFDLLILESCNRVVMGFAHIFDAPVIIMSSLGASAAQYSYFGAPMHPLLYPTPNRQRLYNLSLMEKAIEMFKHFAFNIFIQSTEEYDFKIMRKYFGQDIPDTTELRKRFDMMFLNEHSIWADNRPVPPSILYIGGIHQTQKPELPSDLKTYLDSSEHGVIYVSFGTNVMPSLLPPQKIEMMRKVFSELPYDVLWKYDKESLPVQTKNIKIAEWFPQVAILHHPHVKLFITQGGLQSTGEAIDAAVPVIGIPMLVDQWYNVEKYAHHKIGLQMDIETLNEKEFKDSIDKVITNFSFKHNILRLRSLMRETPVKPLDQAVWWTEHVIKYGGGHLWAPAAHMSWIEYYEVKLILIVLIIFVAIAVFISLMLRSVLRFAYSLYRISIKLKSH